MLKVEEVRLDFTSEKNKFMLHTETQWEPSPKGLHIGDYLKKEAIENKIRGRYLHLFCDDNEYIEPVGAIKKKTIQWIASQSDNISKGQFNLYFAKLRDLYIDLADNLIDMENVDDIKKNFLIRVVDKAGNKVTYFGLAVELELKNNGDLRNTNIEFDVTVYFHELKTVNLILDTIDVTILAAIVYFVSRVISGAFSWDGIDFAFIGVLITYVGQLLIRTIHVRNTYLNRLWAWKRRICKETQINPFRFSVKEFKKRLIKSNLLYDKAKSIE